MGGIQSWRPLLCDVRQLVRKKPLSLSRAGVEPPLPKHDIPADRIGFRVNRACRGRRLSVGMDSDVGEAMAKHISKVMFQDLVKSDLVHAKHYDLGDIGTGHHKRRLYAGDGTPPRLS